MRLVLSLLLLLNLAIFAWTIVGYTTSAAQLSDIEYVLRDLNTSESTWADMRRIVYRGRRDWLVARWLSGGAAFVTLIALAWPRKHAGGSELR